MRTPRPLLALLAVVCAATARADDDPKAVVEKAITAHGGKDALAKHPAGEYKVEGAIASPAGAPKFTGTLAYLLPDKFKVTFDVTAFDKKTSVVQTVDGDDVKSTLDGKDQKVDDKFKAELRQLAANQQVMLLYPLLDEAAGFTLEAGKPAAVGKIKAVAVLVKKKGMKDVHLFFDADTGKLVKTARQGLNADGKEVLEEVVFDDFKEFAKVTMATTQKVTHDGKDFMTMKVTDVKLLDKLDPKTFGTK